ncbi:MAG: aconitate hydratase [Blastocatellia bacterium]|nr:aconitate hydratase [Blastocatellia bacterium]
MNLSNKILSAHLVEGELKAGNEIGIRIDQTLTQDATGTMAYLQFEAMGVPRVKTELSVSYVDHNMLQQDFMNADDHQYLQSVAAKYGLYYSRPGNGICHQVHRERFGIPGKTLIGSDSHTPTCGGLGMIAIGAGGLDVALAMAGQPYVITTPKILGVKLTGTLQNWVSGKDVILELLRCLTCKGGINKIVEYYGPGVASLSMGDRFTITNMGAELGATTSVFPSDDVTRGYLKAQGRETSWTEQKADDDATFDRVEIRLHTKNDERALTAMKTENGASSFINLSVTEPDAAGFVVTSFDGVVIDLDKLEPMIAQPHSPDNVVTVKELEAQDLKAAQACIGSCTNSSYFDLSIAAHMLKDRSVNPGTSFTLTPGSKQVFEMIARHGQLADIIASGARILESACGPCIGMGQAPPSGSVSVRSFNRNFEGRSGTMDAKVYLASPETATAVALVGKIADPRHVAETFGIAPVKKEEPDSYLVNDKSVLPPTENPEGVTIVRGPNIKPIPEFAGMPDTLGGKVALKAGDNISTDHISPAGAKVLPLRSNIPAISEFTFTRVDPEFPKRCREWGGGFVLGGDNYGQGSSREHAALSPRFLGVTAVIVKQFNRIHRANLINFGILPLTFVNPDDYNGIDFADELELPNIGDTLRNATEQTGTLTLVNKTKGTECQVAYDLTERQRKILLAGGVLNLAKQK